MTAALSRIASAMAGSRFASTVLAVLLIAAVHPVSAQPPIRSLDRFDDVAAWKAGASDGVTASVHHVVDAKRPALRLDFDLGGTAGYALARRALPIELPDNYAITFWLRADAPVNDLQIKLVDASGDNVWWYRRPDFAFPREWQLVTIKKRHVEFAWGPTKDRALRQVAAIEFVVASGRDGGRGSLYVSDLELHELPAAAAEWPAPKVRASSTLRGSDAANALDGTTATAWQSNPGGGREQWLSVDFGRPREFGGLVLRFAAGAYASRYDVQFSDDGRKWRTVRRVTEGGPGPAALLLTESETRHLRLAFHQGPKRSYALAEIAVQDLAFGATPHAVREGLRGFESAPHRGQVAAVVDGVRFIDDSKATNVHAAMAAIDGVDDAVLIAGGTAKGVDLSPLAGRADRLRAVVAIGEAAPELARVFEGVRPVRTADTIEDAVRAAFDLARPRGTVLLAPACASWDQFRDYAERGDRFAAAARGLQQEVGAGGR